MIEDKQIKIYDDDYVSINGGIRIVTPGLRSLITSKKPNNYTDCDLQRYEESVYETSALRQQYNSKEHYPRASRSLKWKQTLGPIWNKFRMTGITPPSPMNNTKMSFDNNDKGSLDGTIVDDGTNDDSYSDNSYHSIAGVGEWNQNVST